MPKKAMLPDRAWRGKVGYEAAQQMAVIARLLTGRPVLPER
jgi:hypothetical protein